MGSSQHHVARSSRLLFPLFVVSILVLIAPTIWISIEPAGGLDVYSSFSGEVHLLLKEYPWTSDSGHWGGFSLAETLSMNFEFRRGALNRSSPWELSEYKTPLGKNNKPFGSFTLQQKIPAGISGTCTATYHFEIFSVKGDIGGIHETGGVTSATLDLGLTTWAAKVDNDNCGPDLAETTHPFGGAQTFDVPIETTARLVDRGLSFRTTSQSEVAGGNLVVKSDGLLFNHG